MGWTRNEDLFQDSAMQKYHLESTQPPKKSQNLSGKGLRPSESDAASNCKDIQQNECQAPSHKPSFYDQFWYFFLYYICASQDHPHHHGRRDCSLPCPDMDGWLPLPPERLLQWTGAQCRGIKVNIQHLFLRHTILKPKIITVRKYSKNLNSKLTSYI